MNTKLLVTYVDGKGHKCQTYVPPMGRVEFYEDYIIAYEACGHKEVWRLEIHAVTRIEQVL